MIQMLISVKDVLEAEIAISGGADIIDLKNPAEGALGALALPEIRSIIDFVDASKPVSATIGDVPMDPNLIVQAILQLRDFPLTYIKVGFFQAENYRASLEGIRKIKTTCQPLIAVLFAENNYPESLIGDIRQAGFAGVMLDTAYKNGKTYQDYFSDIALENFASRVSAQNLLFGIAGSLQIKHVDAIKKWRPQFIGFRSGVCLDNQRSSRLDLEKINSIKFMLRL